MSASKPTIGVTGGIGSGKSEVAAILRELACVVSDADALAQQALDEAGIRDELVSWWGSSVLDEKGEVSRSAVAAIVFSNERERRRLEALIHPWIDIRRLKQFASAPEEAPALVIEAPLLYEAGLSRQCDVVIFVDAERKVRLERVMAVRNWDEAELDRRERSQLPLDEKRKSADHVVCNNGDLASLRAEVRRVLDEITQAWRAEQRT